MRLSTKLSSLDRARVIRLLASVFQLLITEVVVVSLSVLNKGEITVEVRDGKAIEVRPTTHLRVGYEVPKNQATDEKGGRILREWMGNE